MNLWVLRGHFEVLKLNSDPMWSDAVSKGYCIVPVH